MSELDSIFIKHSTDKGSQYHNYAPTYQKYLEGIRNQPLIVLELGIGGYHYPDRGGESLRAWKEYLAKAKIYGIDIHDKSRMDQDRIVTFICSQDDEAKLDKIIDSIGNPHIIIDDASHHNDLTIRSFEILFPQLKPGGVYLIEDCHTSYWDEIASTGEDFKGGHHENTVMNYFKRKTDAVNHHASGHINEQIESIGFYRQMIVITKLK